MAVFCTRTDSACMHETREYTTTSGTAQCTFPQPGGPQKINDGTSPVWRMECRKDCCPVTLSCPTKPSISAGLTTSARGEGRELVRDSTDLSP